jgi:hypothetical protein
MLSNVATSQHSHSIDHINTNNYIDQDLTDRKGHSIISDVRCVAGDADDTVPCLVIAKYFRECSQINKYKKLWYGEIQSQEAIRCGI